jgi:hypothetical protein
MARLPQTNVVLGVKAGIAHGLSNATMTMAQSTGTAEANATKTYAKLQPTNIKALAQNLAAIAKAG